MKLTWILQLDNLNMMQPLMDRCILFCLCFLSRLSLHALSLSPHSCPAVCWFEVFCPKAGRRRTDDQLWATDPQVTRPQTVTHTSHTYTDTHRELFVFLLGLVNKFCVCPDHVSVCGLMKLATEERRRQMARRNSREETSSTQHAHCLLHCTAFNTLHH